MTVSPSSGLFRRIDVGLVIAELPGRGRARAIECTRPSARARLTFGLQLLRRSCSSDRRRRLASIWVDHLAVAVGAGELEHRRLVGLQAEPVQAIEDHLQRPPRSSARDRCPPCAAETCRPYVGVHKARLNSAVRAVPCASMPVGDGAIRVTTGRSGTFRCRRLCKCGVAAPSRR